MLKRKPLNQEIKTLEVLWENSRYVAIQKPSGIFTHKNKAFPQEKSLMQVLRDQIGKYVYPIHRLDRGTSGVILFGLDKEATSLMMGKFARREIQKTYMAVVRGKLTKPFSIDSPLLNKDTDVTQEATTQGKPLKFYKSLHDDSLRELTLVKVHPQTGRKHQIRRHLRRLNHPILGDTTYGDSKFNIAFASHLGVRRLWLCASGLEFTEPFTDQRIQIMSQLDKDFRSFIGQAEWQTIWG